MGVTCVLVTYDTVKDKFESSYERSKFYRGLFGFRQKVKQKQKTYSYQKEGLMDEIPHIKVDDSVFIIAQKHLKQLIDYFKGWGAGVDYETFKIVLEGERSRELITDEANES